MRYLEGRKFRLVAEAARERNLLLRHAPHLVRPLEIVGALNGIPRGLFGEAMRFVGVSQKSGPVRLFALKAGLVLYERFGAIERMLPAHKATTDTAKLPIRFRRGTRAVVQYLTVRSAIPKR